MPDPIRIGTGLAPTPPACHRAHGPQGQALRVAAKRAAILDRRSTRRRMQTVVEAEEWLRRGQTKECPRKQVSCQDLVITIREGRHHFSSSRKREQREITPSDTEAVLTRKRSDRPTHGGPPRRASGVRPL